MSKASQAALDQLLSLLANALATIIKDGVKVMGKDGEELQLTAPASFFKEAREFLKDNGVEALPEAHKGIQTLAAVLPFPEQGDDEGFKVG
jgi:hypothetical protein